MSCEQPPMAVVLVAGLHAEARRRTVQSLVRAVPRSVAVHHDLSTAPLGSVHRSVWEAEGELDSGAAPLVNDCGCCALREDLVPVLHHLAEDGARPLAVVELWDAVEPSGIADILAVQGGDAFRLTNVVTALDPALLLAYLANGDDLAEAGLAATPGDRRTVGDTCARQLEYAPVLALLDDEESGAEDLALLGQLHPSARHVRLGSGELVEVAFAGFDVASAAAAQHPASARLPHDCDEAGVSTLVWRTRRPFHPERLYRALEDLCCAAARSRGRFWLADRPDTLLAWEAAGGALCVDSAGPWMAALPDAAWELMPAERRAVADLEWHPKSGDRCQHLVFTSPGLDRAGLVDLLDSCVLTDAELAAGPAAWSRPSGFDELLDSPG